MHRFPNEVGKSFHLIHKDFDNMYIYIKFLRVTKGSNIQTNTQY